MCWKKLSLIQLLVHVLVCKIASRLQEGINNEIPGLRIGAQTGDFDVPDDAEYPSVWT